MIKQGEKRREVVPAVVWTTRRIVCRFFSVEITLELFDHWILLVVEFSKGETIKRAVAARRMSVPRSFLQINLLFFLNKNYFSLLFFFFSSVARVCVSLFREMSP